MEGFAAAEIQQRLFISFGVHFGHWFAASRYKVQVARQGLSVFRKLWSKGFNGHDESVGLDVGDFSF